MATSMLIKFEFGLIWISFVIVIVIVFVQVQGQGEDTPKEEFGQFEDLSPSPNIFQTDKLPTRNGDFLKRYMATIGNGHIATTVFTDTVFMNGLYNGFKGESHRAKIPSRNNFRVKPVSPDNVILNQTFSLDVSKGVFTESFVNSVYQVEQRLFAHRFYHTVIVNQILVQPISFDAGAPPLELELEMVAEPILTSPDFDFEPEIKYESIYEAVTQCGRTKEVEDPHYQREKSLVCILSSNLPEKLTASSMNSTNGAGASQSDSRKIFFTFFTAYDKTLRSASTDFDAVAELVAQGKHEEIYESHTREWSTVWEEGRIEVEGNLQISKVINGCWYYLLSSLPIVTATNTNSNSGGPNGEFYGVSPGSLASGEYLNDYQGHSFWDTEVWMLPPILYFYPEVAKAMLNYRLFVLQAARDRALETGFKGARFPWESCFTGREVTPDCCPETRDFQIHVTGDIAFAIRQYISFTRDLAWLKEPQPGYVSNGMGLLKEIAEFWISRTTFDPIANQHDILHVMPPDEDHHDVDNSVYTNVIAAYAVFFAKYSECLSQGGQGQGQGQGRDRSNNNGEVLVPEKWVEIAKSLKLIHDPIINYHPEYEDYPVGEQIKRADVVLLGYPLMYPMPPAVRKNDLLLYGNVTRTNGPGMTWAMYTVGYLEFEELRMAEELFNRSYKPYMREPFKIWTEAQPPTLGTVNFLTGMGGFLQEIISGYGGMRLMTEKIVFYRPRVLPNSQRLIFHGIKYLGNVLDISIDTKNILLKLVSASPKHTLRVELVNGSVVHFSSTTTILLAVDLFTSLKQFELSASPSNCPLPVDAINQDYQFSSAWSLIGPDDGATRNSNYAMAAVVIPLLRSIL